MKIRVADVIVDNSICPRVIDDHTVEVYMEKIQIGEVFPAIEILADNRLVAGKHRLEAHKQLGIEEIEAVHSLAKNDKEALLLSARENAKHGKPDSGYDIRKYTEAMHKVGFTVAEIAKEVKRSERTIQGLLQSIREIEQSERDTQISKAMEEEGSSQRGAAEQFDVSRGAIEKSLERTRLQTAKIAERSHLEQLQMMEMVNEGSDDIPQTIILQHLLKTQSLAMLYGPSGIGKSTIASKLCDEIAAGQTYLFDVQDLQPEKNRKILYITFEEPNTKTLESKRKHSIHGLQFISLMRQHVDMKMLETFISGEYNLIVIDSFKALYKNMYGNDLDIDTSLPPGEVNKIMMPLQEIALKQNKCILFIHHTNKAGEFYGSTDLKDPCNTVFEYSEKSKYVRRLSIVKARDSSFLNGKYYYLRFDEENNSITRDGGKEQGKENNKPPKPIDIDEEKVLAHYGTDHGNQLDAIERRKGFINIYHSKTGEGRKGIYDIGKNEFAKFCKEYITNVEE